MNQNYQANAIDQRWRGAEIDHVGVEQSECSVGIYLTNGKFVQFQPKLNLWHRGINMMLCRSDGGWGEPKSEQGDSKNSPSSTVQHTQPEIVHGAAGAYCRKHGDNGTLESAFKAGVEWAQHQAGA